MEFIPLAAMILLVISGIDLLKYLRAADWNAAATILTVWLAGVVVTFLVAQTDFASGIAVENYTLATLNGWSLLFLGLSIGGSATGANKILKAVDNSQSAATPKLFTDTDK